jgi:hypothetical protein
MKLFSLWVVVVVMMLAFAASCFGGKRGSGTRGTNTGSGSDNDGPWNQGGGVPASFTQQP